jgi:hypothetical protein
MKFAHIRVSEYFTFAEQIFHSEAISHGEAIFHARSAFHKSRKGFISLKKALAEASAFFHGIVG